MPGNIPVAPTNPYGPSTPSTGGTSPAAGGGGGGGKSGSGKSGGSSSSSSSNPYLAAQRKSEKKAAKRLLEQAATLRQQVRALRAALGDDGFRRALDTQLANVRLDQRQQDQVLLGEFRVQRDTLLDQADDNTKAAAAQSFANLANMGSERTAALSEALAMGAGESDMLRAQAMALANWNANQNEIARSFFDTRSSINSSLTELSSSARTNRINNAVNADADREQLWRTYYDNRSETLTQLGNVLGQLADTYASADELDGSKRVRKQMKRARRQSGKAFLGAADAAGDAYESPGIPKRLMKWQGARPVDTDLGGDRGPALTTIAPAKPEGATLRSWT